MKTTKVFISYNTDEDCHSALPLCLSLEQEKRVVNHSRYQGIGDHTYVFVYIEANAKGL